MLTFTLAISCLTTSYLPWFMDLTFQVPMQYCSLQHWTLLPSPGTSTTGVVFALALSLHSLWSYFSIDFHCIQMGICPAYWAPTDLGSSSFSVLSFCLFILLMGSQGKNTEVVSHPLLQWTMFCQNSPPWPVHLGCLYAAWLIVLLS